MMVVVVEVYNSEYSDTINFLINYYLPSLLFIHPKW